MTLIKIIFTKLLFVLAIIIANTFSTYPQGGHVSLQLIGNVVVDYREDPVSYTYYDGQFEKWYVDDSGILRLRYSELDRILRDSDGVAINGLSQFEIDFFVPKPGCPNLVYCFGRGACVVVELSQCRVTDIIELNGSNSDLYLVVHHSNDEDVWILYFCNYTIHKYLFSQSGIDYLGSIPMEHSVTSIRLSKDCRYYSAVSQQYNGENYVYYGSFDRATGNLSELSAHCYSSPSGSRFEIDNSIISIDNSRIYYNVPCSLPIDEMRSYVIEVPIIDGMPAFLSYNVVHSFVQTTLMPLASFFYGCDCVYILRLGTYYMERIGIDGDGDTNYDCCFFHIPTYDNWGFPDYLVSSWHISNVCGDSHCANPPDAQFDNASLCYGEPLNVILRGVAPFTLDYTLDGESISIPDISTDAYKMPDTPGKYSILKVSDKNCTSVPQKNNNAVINKEMKPLKIKIGE